MMTFINDDKTIFGDSVVYTLIVIKALYHSNVNKACRFIFTSANPAYVFFVYAQATKRSVNTIGP